MSTSETSSAALARNDTTQSLNPAPPSQPTTTAIGRASIFDFFGLPRELRDLIYEQPELLEQKTVTLEPNYPDFSDMPNHSEPAGEPRLSTLAATIPKTNILLVSHRFAEEYFEKRLESTTLAVREGKKGWDQEFRLSGAATRARSLNIELLCDGYYPHATSAGDFPYVAHWVSDWTARMPYLKSITLTMYADCDADLMGQ